MNAWLILLAGLAVLTAGAEALVRGGASLALRLGLTPLVIGLTIVAYGTSSPEMVVSVQAALRHEGAIAVGNVIGSNICNIALILALCALIKPLRANATIIRRELPLLLGVSVVAAAMLLDGTLNRFEGGVLTVGLIAYTIFTVRAARRSRETATEREFAQSLPPRRSLLSGVVLTLGGLGLLIWGSDLFVHGAVAIATSFGLSPVVIGLTIVAVGTSMPELATSVVAVLRNEVDVALGNVVGSNLFNLLGILGVSALIQPLHAPELSYVDLGAMLVTALLLLPVVRSGGRISRWEGGALLAGYGGYTTWLIVQ